MEKHPNDIGIFYVSGIGTARMLNRFTNSTKSRLIVINTTYPGIIRHPKRFKAVLNLNTKHPRAGEWVAQYLINIHHIQAKHSGGPRNRLSSWETTTEID